ncbi:MAG: hypothetical protein JNJ60_02065 [Rhodocyclaceae bacterium]|nr:hypothetical protein [Rhodocyclaceae bacterium]
MKPYRLILAVLLCALLAGCGPKLDGTYADPAGLTAFTFRSSGKVYYGALGSEQEGTYEIDGDRVKVNVGGAEPIILRIKDAQTLDGPLGIPWKKQDPKAAKQ